MIIIQHYLEYTILMIIIFKVIQIEIIENNN